MARKDDARSGEERTLKSQVVAVAVLERGLEPQMATKAEADGETNGEEEQEVKVSSDDVEEHEPDESKTEKCGEGLGA